MTKINYKDLQKAIIEVNETIGTKQKYQNIPRKVLEKFLYEVYIKYSEKLPEFAYGICESIQEPILDIEEDEDGPCFGFGFDEKTAECKQCLLEAPTEATKCRILTKENAKKTIQEKQEYLDSLPMNVMFSVMCCKPDMSRDEFRKAINDTKLQYNETSFQMVFRRVKKVVRLLRQFGHMP